MKKTSIHQPVVYRHNDWGPAYLLRDDPYELGVVRLRPGDEVDNHYHRHCVESFIVMEGSCTLWVDQGAPVTLTVGDIVSSAANEQHYLRNDTEEPCRFIFLKTPSIPGDTIAVPWVPSN